MRKKQTFFTIILDESNLFKGTVVKEDRSLMNVPFVTGDKEMDAKFVKAATEAGFVNLKGHRTVGGMRASIYNAMPIEGVEKLVAFHERSLRRRICKMSNYTCLNAISPCGSGSVYRGLPQNGRDERCGRDSGQKRCHA